MNEKLYNALSQYVLSALGEDPTNEEIKAQYRPVFETVLKDDKFVEAFTSNPEETATALAQEIVKYQENAASQQEAIMAKKGARLMKLKKGGKKKCACGCELVEKKEAGGKVSSVCSCGCKVKPKLEEGGLIPKYQNPFSVINKLRDLRQWLLNTELVKGLQTKNISGESASKRERSIAKDHEYFLQNLARQDSTTKEHLTQQNANIESAAKKYEEFLANKETNTQSNVKKKKPTVIPGKRVPNPDISIIDYLDSKGEKSDPASRKKIAERFGMSNYKGSGTQNLELIRLLKEEPKILAARAADAGVDFNYIPEEKVRKETLVEVKKPTLIVTEKPTLVKKKKLGLFSKKK